MGLKRKLFLVILSLVTVFACVFGFVGCNNQDNPNDPNKPDDSSHTYAEGWTGDDDYHWHAATDGSDAVSEKALHDWQLAADESVAATCSAAGTNVYKCSVCKDTKRETTTQLTHVWSTDTQTQNPTCTEGGRKYKTCSNAGCGATSTVEYLPATGHTAESAATCTQASKCSVCKVTISPALGHDYQVVSTVAATCSADGSKHYVCSHDGCEETYDETHETKLPHNIVWGDEGEIEHKHTAGICYTITYTGNCMNEGCKHTETKSTDVTSHAYTTAITAVATCSVDGTKSQTCKVCSYQTSEPYKDANAHIWNNGTVSNGITTFTCTHNSAHTKKSVVSPDTSSVFSADAVKSAGEVTLADTSIKLDDGVKNALPAGDVTLGAEKINDLSQLEGVYLNGSDAQIITGTVFNLTLNAGGQNVSDLGGTVSVTVPYTISPEEDPNNIVILYINGDKLEEVTGTYSNGFVTFETTHFSYYTVTRMTPADRCNKFGHAFKTYHQEPTCLLAGYDMNFCTRCGINEKEDIAALGHDWETQKTAATCLVNGKTHYECKRCDVEYDITIPAYGHVWETTAYSAATCQASGNATYKCELCEETYSTTIPQTSHTLVSTKVEATCTTSGYTHNECIVCGHVNDTDHVDALGHTTATKVVEATCTVSGFTQTYCTVCNTEISKTNVVAANGHNMSNGVCTVCGHGCEHNYISGEVVEPSCETEGYVLYTCSKCNSSYKGNIVNALGHIYNADECEVCHKPNPAARDYYLNLVNTALNGTVSITVKELSFDDKTLSFINGSPVNENVLVSAEQLDVIKLTLTLSADGDIIGAGEGSIKLSIDTGSGLEYVSMDCDFVVKDGTVYIVINSDNQQAVPSMYMSIEFDYMFGAMSNGALNYDTIKEYLLWYNGKVSPILNNLITTNSDIVVSVLRYLLNNAFITEPTSDGYTYTADFSAIERLNEALYTTPVKDIVENFLGEGVYAKLPALVTTVLNLTPAQALTFVQQYGIDKKQVCAAIDAIMLLITGNEFNSEKMLDDFLSGKVSEGSNLTYNNITVAELIIIYTQLKVTKDEFIGKMVQMVTATLDNYKDKTVYEVIADIMSNMGGGSGAPDYNRPPEMAKEGALSAEMIYETVRGYIIQYVSTLQGSVQMSFSTDKEGNIISAKIKADINDFVMDSYENGNSNPGEVQTTDEILNVKGEVEFTFGGSSTVNEEIINKVNAAKPKFERNSIITAYSNKHFETQYSDMFPNLYTFDKGEEMLVHTDVRGNIVKIVVTTEMRNRRIENWEGNYVYCYENIEKRVEEYDFTGGSAFMVSKNYCGNIDMYDIMGMCTAYVERTSYERVIHSRTQVIISDRILNSRVEEPYTYQSSKSFYYDTEKGAYTAENPHSYEKLVLNDKKSKIECGGYYYLECEACGYGYASHIYHLDNDYHNNVKYELAEGAANCEEGVLVMYVCRECEEVVDSYTTYGHETYLKDIIDCTTNTCKHTIYLYGCACGKYLHTGWVHEYWHYDSYRYGEGFDSIRPLGDYIYTVNGKEQKVNVYACVVVDNNAEGTCGFNFAYYTDYTKDSTCYATYAEHIIFNVTISDKRTVTGGTVYTGNVLPYYYNYEHNTKTTHTETSNGFIDESRCEDCGLKVETTEYAESRVNGLLVSKTETHTIYKNSAEDNTEDYSYKMETAYTYAAPGQVTSETILITYYGGAVSSGNITSYQKDVTIWTYNSDGSYATLISESQHLDGYNRLTSSDRWEYVFVQGERFATLHYDSYDYYDKEGNYSETPSIWNKTEYDYSNGYCSPMIKESTQAGESPVRPGVVSHRGEGVYIIHPTCTQLGTLLCKFCHQEVQDTDHYFEGHHYNNGVCDVCGLENPKELNGRVVLEDLSYTSESDYIIGYYNREGVEYSFQFSLINLDADEYDNETVLFDVNYYDSNEGAEELNYYRSGKITFSVGQIAYYAAEYGIKNYMIRVYFVSERYGSNLDYAITIDAHKWVEGTLIYSHYVYETGEQVDETITVKYCSVCGIVLDYGYLNLSYAYEDEGTYYYFGRQSTSGYGCELRVSTPIENIEIPPVDETL
ncbi:MAG: hypothetical protein K2L12_00690 [Clostridia bacterium]|nr:hypothetical protein [Clostridia bacterium]